MSQGDPAETFHADGDVDDGTSPLDNIALDKEFVKKRQWLDIQKLLNHKTTDLLDELVVTEDDNTNVVGLQVDGHALQARAEENW